MKVDWRVLSSTPSSKKLSLSEPLLTRELPLVDRTEELALLKSLFDQTVVGKGQVVSIAGEGGVGKTRLVSEIGRYARDKGGIFAVGPSYEEEASVPYSPWIEAIRSVLRQMPSSQATRTTSRTLAEVARIVPELAPGTKELGIKGWLVGQEPSDLIGATDIDRARLFQAVTDLLTNTSTTRPIILFLDDIIWADAASIQLVHYFCRRIRDHRIMVIAAYRDAELPSKHPLSTLLLDLNRERVLRQLTLSSLTTDYVSEIIANHLGGGAVAPDFARLIHTRTGGNPFFVEELLRHLVEEGMVQKTSAGWTLKEIGEVDIPSTVRAVIEQRVSRLGEELVQTISIASVIGMNFTFELLRSVIDAEEELLITQLESMIRSRLLTEKRVGRDLSYLFPDEQIRDYFYRDLSLIRRRKIHSRIAHSIEEHNKNAVDEHLDELAYHYIQASELGKAAEYSLKAGDRAFKLHAYPEAKEHYRNVLDLIEENQTAEKLDVLTKLGDTSYQMGESRDATKYYTEALDRASRLKHHSRAVYLYSRLGYVFWSLESDKQNALVYFRRGLDALKASEEGPEKAALLQDIGRLLVITGEAEEGRPLCEEALGIAKRLNIFPVQVHAIQTLAITLARDSQHKADILQKCEEALKIALEHGLEEPTCRAFHNLGCQLSFIKADYEKSGQVLAQGVEFSHKTVDLMYEAIMEAELALYVHLPLGAWDKALEEANRSLRLSSEYEIKVSLSKSYMALGVTSLCKGDLDKAEEYLSAAEPLVEKIMITEWSYTGHLASGRLYLEKHEHDKAEQHLLAAADVGQHKAYISTHDSLFELVRLYLEKRETRKAEEAYQTLKRAAEDLDEPWAYAYESWALGLLALSTGRTEEAIAALKKSADLWNQLKHRYNYARTLLELAKVLPKTKDHGRASELEQAMTIFSQLGATLDIRRAQAAK